MDWFKEQLTGQPHDLPGENRWFPSDFPETNPLSITHDMIEVRERRDVNGGSSFYVLKAPAKQLSNNSREPGVDWDCVARQQYEQFCTSK